MRMFPRAAIVIDSPLAPREAEAALRTATASRGRDQLDFRSYAFEGEVDALRIDIQRATPPSRAPRIRVTGRIVPHAGGSRLVASADLAWVVHAGMLAWIVFLVIAGAVVGEGSVWEIPPFFAVVTLGWLAQWLLFMHQAHAVRDLLVALLNGVLVDEEKRDAAMEGEPMPA